MARFTVSVREVHIAFVDVEAASPEAAIEAVREGEGEHQDVTEYSHALDTDLWTVEPAREGK